MAHSAGTLIRASDLVPEEWTDYAVSWTAATTNPTLGNGTLSAKYIHHGKLIIYKVSLVWGSTTSGGTGSWRFDAPGSPSSANGRDPFTILYRDGSSNYWGMGFFSSAAIILSTASGGAGQANATTPFAWGTGDELFFVAVYEATTTP